MAHISRALSSILGWNTSIYLPHTQNRFSHHRRYQVESEWCYPQNNGTELLIRTSQRLWWCFLNYSIGSPTGVVVIFSPTSLFAGRLNHVGLWEWNQGVTVWWSTTHHDNIHWTSNHWFVSKEVFFLRVPGTLQCKQVICFDRWSMPQPQGRGAAGWVQAIGR